MAKQLGYACINMTLSKDGVSCNKTMIRKTFQTKGIEYASEIILKNLQGLRKIVEWNNENNVKVYRMSSSMFPWMSEYELSDLNKSIFNSYSTRNFVNHPLSVYEDALSYILKPMK